MNPSKPTPGESASPSYTFNPSLSIWSGGLGAFSLDPETDTIRADRRASALFGFADPPPDAAEWRRRIHPDDRQIVSDYLSALTRPGEIAEFKHRVAAGGHCRWVLCRAEGQPAMDDRPAHIAGVIIDVTTQQAELENLKHSQARLRQAIEAAPLPVIIHAEDGRIVHLSETFLEITGYRREDLPTTLDWVRRAFRERASDLYDFLRSRYELEGPAHSGEHIVHTAPGTERLWSFYTSPIGRDSNGNRMVLTMAVDLTEQRKHEERMQLTMREMNHRTKNVLAKVQAIIRLSQKLDPENFANTLETRILSLARVHALIGSGQYSLSLPHLLQTEMAALAFGDQWRMSGPAVEMQDPEIIQSLGMVLQELITNAAKYGALSDSSGKVQIDWQHDVAADRFLLEWRESLQRRIEPPARTGFGTFLLNAMVKEQLGGRIDMTWEARGLTCRIELPATCFAVSGDS